MSSVSTIPALLDGLVGRWTAALPQVQVVDGQPLQTDPDVIAVGFTGTPGEVAVESAVSGRGADMESYEVHCIASSWRGTTDPATVRDLAFALVDACADDLARDQTVGKVVMRARVSVAAFAPEQTTDGAVATVAFTVHVEAQAGRLR